MPRTIAARLTLIVEFNEIPDDDTMEEIVDLARGQGTIVTANLVITKDTVKDLR